MVNLEGKKVFVTGGSSMIGRQVVKILGDRNAIVYAPSHSYVDLLAPVSLLKVPRDIDYCIHCAGYNGNIQFNKKFPAEIFLKTARMALNILEFCENRNIKKVVSVLPSCAYPDGLDILKESDFLSGKPNDSVECHGLAKRILFNYSRQLHKQHGSCNVCVVLNNSYGPYDSFDINKTKVIGGMIKRFLDAQRDGLSKVTCWGTGSPRREFVYCADAAEGIVRSLESYDDPLEPINIGTGSDISIKDLAELVAEVVGYQGQIEWDVNAGDGQMKKLLDVSKMERVLQFHPTTSLKDGLEQTVRWLKEQ